MDGQLRESKVGRLETSSDYCYTQISDRHVEGDKPIHDPQLMINVPASARMRTEILLIKYNQPDYEARTIEAVARHTEGVEYTLTAYQNKRGVGLATCWNRLIEQSDAEAICLLNSDTIPAKKWLSLMLETLESDPGIGAVMPSSNNCSVGLVHVPFSVAERNFDTINDFAAALRCQHNAATAELDVGAATCLLFRRAVWKEAGKFDEDFFLYGEDSEFTWRLHHKFGYRLLWRKAAYVHHHKARSVEKAIKDQEFDYNKIRAEATRLWRMKTGKDRETGEQLK
jgi:cellulose synthase/poly-beta-1,6-N-acetylglucosamine synthase-like glycosyltransferase